ncbi:hypothetical protein [Muricomes intestini]|jgi:hypothetical protein|uniref:Integral membrane YwaF-like protein n=1 Tax=Muricomes intestini TaxID=1796634 RepID=A0A4R3K7M6_9FIRM|nr:hypothetical protein [Muricomes intestini]TCS78808.1 hypothetical protein EDD59_11017 [Muricomes intestini]HAX50739.1 hypothetical protein [Lachnospiraceae bacterium]HCR83724.1 hypothetical protein [Lachnospiraceae bacterium]
MNKFRMNTSYKFNSFFLGCGILMAASEVWKQWYLTFVLNGGFYQWWFFPFQLCSVPMYVLVILPRIRNFRARNALLTFLMCYGLLGGIAVFADTSGLQYPSLCLTVHSYLWHIMLITVGVIAGITCIIESSSHILSWRQSIDGTLIYFLCCLIASLINHLFGAFGSINMFYINPYYRMQQIGFTSLVRYCGNNLAILIYILATVFGASILFCVWMLISHFSCSS